MTASQPTLAMMPDHLCGGPSVCYICQTRDKPVEAEFDCLEAVGSAIIQTKNAVRGYEETAAAISNVLYVPARIKKAFADIVVLCQDHVKELEHFQDYGLGLKIALSKELQKPKSEQKQDLIKGYKMSRDALDADSGDSRVAYTAKMDVLMEIVNPPGQQANMQKRVIKNIEFFKAVQDYKKKHGL